MFGLGCIYAIGGFILFGLGCIYAIGGWDGQNIVKSIEKFDPNTGKWTHVTDYINMR